MTVGRIEPHRIGRSKDATIDFDPIALGLTADSFAPLGSNVAESIFYALKVSCGRKQMLCFRQRRAFVLDQSNQLVLWNCEFVDPFPHQRGVQVDKVDILLNVVEDVGRR